MFNFTTNIIILLLFCFFIFISIIYFIVELCIKFYKKYKNKKKNNNIEESHLPYSINPPNYNDIIGENHNIDLPEYQL